MRRNTFIDFIIVSIMISIFGVSLRLFLTFEQQQRGSAHKHAMSLINHGELGMPVIVKTQIKGSGEACRRMMTRDDNKYCTVQ